LPQEGNDLSGPLTLSLSFTEYALWTGLQIASTPGKGVVLAGAILMMIGLFFSFYIAPRRYWGLVRQEDKGALLVLAGESSRNQLAFKKGLMLSDMRVKGKWIFRLSV